LVVEPGFGLRLRGGRAATRVADEGTLHDAIPYAMDPGRAGDAGCAAQRVQSRVRSQDVDGFAPVEAGRHAVRVSKSLPYQFDLPEGSEVFGGCP
jgi:hypothetical protein